MKGLCQNEVKARIERQKSERAVSRNHKHFWTGQKPFYQCNGGPFGRFDAWNPDKRNQPQCILLQAASSPDADMGPTESASREVRSGNLFQCAKIQAALWQSSSQIPVYVRPGRALEYHVTLRCQVVNAGTLSTDHSFGTEAWCCGPWHFPATLYLLNNCWGSFCCRFHTPLQPACKDTN